MVINVGAVKDKDWDFVREDIRAVVEASKPAIVKVIIETCLLTDEEKVKTCQLSEEAGAAFVKTSTGFFHRRRHRRGYPADERDRRRSSGGESQRRHPHTGIYGRTDRSRRGPDRCGKRCDPAVSGF